MFSYWICHDRFNLGFFSHAFFYLNGKIFAKVCFSYYICTVSSAMGPWSQLAILDATVICKATIFSLNNWSIEHIKTMPSCLSGIIVNHYYIIFIVLGIQSIEQAFFSEVNKELSVVKS